MLYDDINTSPHSKGPVIPQIVLIILIIAAILTGIWCTFELFQRIQNRRRPGQRENAQPVDFERNWADGPIAWLGIELQPPQRAVVRQPSIGSMAAPRYEEIRKDRRVPEHVKLEQRDRYSYIAQDEQPVQGERPPSYRRLQVHDLDSERE